MMSACHSRRCGIAHGWATDLKRNCMVEVVAALCRRQGRAHFQDTAPLDHELFQLSGAQGINGRQPRLLSPLELGCFLHDQCSPSISLHLRVKSASKG